MAGAALPLIEGLVTLGIQVGTELVPVIKGAIVSIKKEITPQGTVQFSVVISADQTELTAIEQSTVAEIQAINLELSKQNAPALDVPPAPAP